MRHLWVARDMPRWRSAGPYHLSAHKPTFDKGDGYWSPTARGFYLLIPDSLSPVKLKPGGGPVKVKIVPVK